MYKFENLRTGPVNMIIVSISVVLVFLLCSHFEISASEDAGAGIIFGFLGLTAFAIIFEWYIKLVEIIWFTPARIRDSITTRSVEKLNKIRVAENKAKREFERFIEDCRK